MVQATGAQVIPISYSLPDEELKTMVKSVNGLLIPGTSKKQVGDIAYNIFNSKSDNITKVRSFEIFRATMLHNKISRPEKSSVHHTHTHAHTASSSCSGPAYFKRANNRYFWRIECVVVSHNATVDYFYQLHYFGLCNVGTQHQCTVSFAVLWFGVVYKFFVFCLSLSIECPHIICF